MGHEKNVYELIKKKETKGYKNTHIAPGMHCGYRGRVQDQN